MQNTLAYGIVLIGTVLWCLGFILPPLSVDTRLSVILYDAYYRICHQLPEHSFSIAGHPLAVCVRCTAIYGGFLLGLILLPFVGNKIVKIASYRYAVFILALPIIVDVTLSWLTSYTSTITSRFFSGGFFGVGVVFIITPLWFQAIDKFPTSSKQLYKEDAHVT